MKKQLFLLIVFAVSGISVMAPQIHSQSGANKAILLEAVQNLVGNIPGGSTILITAISGNNELSSQYIQSVIIHEIWEGTVVLTEKRRALDIAMQDDYLSGTYEYGNDVQIGRMRGANIIVTGGVFGNGDFRRIVFWALDVETAQIVSKSCVLFTQNKTEFIKNIEELSKKINEGLYSNIRSNSSITIINAVGTNRNADFVFDKIESDLVNLSSYKIVTREQAKSDLLREERYFHDSEYVSEATVSKGRQIGAQYIITIGIVNNKIQAAVIDVESGIQIIQETL